MKRNTIIVFAFIGIVAVVCLAAVAFIMVTRMSHMGRSFGPGMMNGYSEAGQAPGGFVVDTPASTPLTQPTQGIQAPQSAQSPENTALPENTMMEKAGNLTVLLAISPYPPVRTKSSGFDVTLKDENGNAISDAVVSFDLTMPDMPMPPNKFVAKYTDNGLYHGAGRFTMGGLWRIEVIIQRGTEKVSAFFNVNL
jgi:hypothetical protein